VLGASRKRSFARSARLEDRWKFLRCYRNPCLGDGPAATAWATAQHAALLARGPTPLLATISALPAPTPEAREARRRVRGYVLRNAERMDYPLLRADGLPTGSAAVESAAAHIVQLRLKRPGLRWSDLGAAALLTLCARLCSNRPLVA
jgi:hypothetical protein